MRTSGKRSGKTIRIILPYRLLSWLPFLFFGSHWSRTGIITGGPRFTILQQLRWGSWLYKTSELRRRQEKALKNNGSSGGAASKAQSSQGQGQDKESLEKASQSNDAASTLAPADDDGDGDTISDEEK
mmetsp:Transcript_1463/g.2033  ORF Transcript_1463/g.2033 Transcript_1463/m.2033 type:complete len:128 (-) Transcript_1463:206-589(-)